MVAECPYFRPAIILSAFPSIVGDSRRFEAHFAEITERRRTLNLAIETTEQLDVRRTFDLSVV
jgi:hypothetical protein